MELNVVEKEIDGLLGKTGFYLQTYRSLDAFNLLQQAEGRMADEGWLTETNQPFFVPLGVIAI